MTEGYSPGHVPPLYCPYCAEDDLRPAEDVAGGWVCTACRRVFTVRLAGLTAPEDGRGLR